MTVNLASFQSGFGGRNAITKRGKFVAFIYYKKVRQYLGTFDTAEEAKAAYDEAWEERKERTVEELNGEWAPKEVDIILIQT